MRIDGKYAQVHIDTLKKVLGLAYHEQAERWRKERERLDMFPESETQKNAEGVAWSFLETIEDMIDEVRTYEKERY